MNLSNQDVQLGQAMFESFLPATGQPGKHPLGTRGCCADGRVYRYVKAGAVDLIAGTVVQSAAPPAGQLTKAINTTSAVAVGATALTVTCASSVAAGFYNDGYLVVASGAGQGYIYTIINHPAVSTGASGIFTLYDEDKLVVAVTITSTVTLMPNKYSGVIVLPATTATGVIVGVATYVIAAGAYGWVQTWGPCAVQGADTTAIGALVYGPATASGQASGYTATTLLTGQTIGRLMQANVAAQWVAVDLTISP